MMDKSKQIEQMLGGLDKALCFVAIKCRKLPWFIKGATIQQHLAQLANDVRRLKFRLWFNRTAS